MSFYDSEYDEDGTDLHGLHGRAVKLECLRPWTNEEYIDAVSPWYISASYKITYEDGAEVEIGALHAYTLAQGSFWYVSDSSKTPPSLTGSVFARDEMVLAYLARVAEALKREIPGECKLPETEDEAERILSEIDVPFEALRYGCDTAKRNMDRWGEKWEKEGRIKWSERDNGWVILDEQKNLLLSDE